MIATKNDMITEFLELLKEITEIEEIFKDTKFSNAGVSSMDLLELGWFIEEKYNVSLETETLRNLKNTEELVEVVINERK